MKQFPELEGFWWVPDAPDEQLAGRLVTDNDSAKLILTIDTPGRLPFSQSESRNYDLIHGRTASGKQITLLHCFDLNTHWSSNGVEKRVVLANYVLEGGLIPAEKLEEPFKGLELHWPSLQNWFGITGLKAEYDKENYNAFTLSYHPPEPIKIGCQTGLSIRFIFGTDSIPFPSPRGASTRIREMVWVSVSRERPGSLEYFLGKLSELIHFFSLCTLEYTEPERIVLTGAFDEQELEDGTRILPHLTLYKSDSHQPRSDRPPHPIEILVPYSAISEDFESILSTWVEGAEEIAPVRSLYFSSIYGGFSYLETTFLALAQAVEVLHRRKYGGTYIAKDEFSNNILPVLKNAIPSTLPSDVRQAYSQRLAHFNEISLAKRIKLLSDRYSVMWNRFVPNLKPYIRGVVDARNYFTHYSSTSPSSKPEVGKLLDYQDFLKALLELEMLASTGLTEGRLMQMGLNCRQYQRTFDSSRRG